MASESVNPSAKQTSPKQAEQGAPQGAVAKVATDSSVQLAKGNASAFAPAAESKAVESKANESTVAVASKPEVVSKLQAEAKPKQTEAKPQIEEKPAKATKVISKATTKKVATKKIARKQSQPSGDKGRVTKVAPKVAKVHKHVVNTTSVVNQANVNETKVTDTNVDKTSADRKETIMTKKTTNEALKHMEVLTGDFSDNVRKTVEKSNKWAEEAVAFHKANFDAIVESSEYATKGLESLSHTAAQYGREVVEEATASVKDYAAVKSPAEFFQLYSENSRKAFDAAVAYGSKASEIFVKTSNDTVAPIANRVSDIATKELVAA